MCKREPVSRAQPSFLALALLLAAVSEIEGAYGFRKSIRIDHNRVGGTADLVDFPLLIHVTDPDLRTTVNGGMAETGFDIVFRSGAGTNLDFEIERYDPLTGELVAWVRLPTLAYNVDTFLYVYYGDPAVVTSQENVAGVWSGGFAAVWHLDEDPALPSPEFPDVTSNPNNGTAVTLATIHQVPGRIEGSLHFDDSSERHVFVPHHASLQFATSVTVSAWVRTIDTDSDVGVIANKWKGGGHKNYWLGKLNATQIEFNTDNDVHRVTTSLSLISDDSWHHVAGVLDAANNRVRIFVDGIERNSAFYDGVSQTGTADLMIGRSSDVPAICCQEFDGRIDEVRLSGAARPAGWLLTEFNNQSSPSTFYFFGVAESTSGCPPLSTSESAGTLVVTAPDSFEMVFDRALGGAVTEFYDLAEDPGRTNDCAGGASGTSPLVGLLQNGMVVNNPGPLAHSMDQNSLGPKLDLLESTTTRVRVRQEAFYQEQSGGTAIVPGMKGIGDYSIYPSGRTANKWERRTTAAVTTINHGMGAVVVHATTGGDLDRGNWSFYTDSGPPPPTAQPGTDTFSLAQIEVGGAKTDFLNIIHQDYLAATSLSLFETPADEWAGWTYYDADGTTYAANSSELWNFLTYFKPTNFADHMDPAVTKRRDDYRGPGDVGATVGPGTRWIDTAEKTGPSDSFNEAEAAYLLQLDPAAGLTFDLNGGTTTRYAPFFKIRQWRSHLSPGSVTLEGAGLTSPADYRSDVKPISRAYFAQDLRWYTTAESNASITTSPDVGTAGTVEPGVGGFVPGRHGNGVYIPNATSSWISFPTTGNFDSAKGAIEFWFKPDFASTDGSNHTIGGYNFNGANNWLFSKDNADNLKFEIAALANTSSISAGPATYRWQANEWVHLRFEWDDSLPVTTQLKIFVNGVEPNAGGGTGADYVAATNVSANFQIGRRSPTTGAPGVYDEIRVYGGSGATPQAIAHAGSSSDAREFLASGTLNFSLAFTTVDANRRGEYLYFGSDAKFHGLNVALATPGAGASPNLHWQFWNGTSWADLEMVGGFLDETSNLTQNGAISWTSDPAGWSVYTMKGGPELYYVRAYLASGDFSTQSPVEGVVKTDILLFQYCGDIALDGQTFVFPAAPPTAVRLSHFEAFALDGAVELRWSTESELDNLGFHLLRSLTENGQYERISAKIIPGLGSSPEGAAYRFRDEGLTNGTLYYYQLQDVETTGRTELHGPVSARPQAGAGDDDGPTENGEQVEGRGTRITYGAPDGTSLRMVHRAPHLVVAELETGGFHAYPEGDGSLRLVVPDFEARSEDEAVSLPVKRAWLDGVAGRKVSIVRVVEREVEVLSGLRPVAGETPEVFATSMGTVRGSRRISRRSGRPGEERLYPAEAARLVTVGFQGERKRALLEMAPLRWDAATETLRFARRLTVYVSFRDADDAETGTSGGRGRRPRRSSHTALGRVAARIVTRERGLYGVPFEEISSMPTAVPVSNLRVSRLGEATAFHVEPNRETFGPGSMLFFVGEGADSNPFSGESIYELALGVVGRTMPIIAAKSGAEPVSHYWHELELEENRYYQAGLVNVANPWFWEIVVSPGAKRFPFSLLGLASSPDSASLSVWLQGTSDLPALPDHHVRVFVNGTFVEEVSWDGKNPRVLRAALAPGVLREGENEILIENVGDTGAAYSMVMLDKLEVRYPRIPVAADGHIQGTFDERGVVDAHYVVELREDSAPVWIEGREVEPGPVYLAVSAERVRRPEIRRPLPTRLRDERKQADYVLVAPRELLSATEPLVRLRREQGLRVETVAVEEVYSEFGYGEPRPESIREFLAYAYHHWRPPSIRYVLLLGDATYDYKDYLATGVRNQVPPYIVRTSYLWTASDPAYASVNGDDLLPDVAIGRLPAASVDGARAVIDKILAFESSGGSPEAPIVLVADNPDRAGNFESDAEELAASVLGGRELTKIYLSRLGPDGARRAVVNAFDQGASILNYLGHGGIHLWADEKIFDTSNVSSLSVSPRLPVVLTMNCLNGYFHFPYFGSLAEELVTAPGRGAIAAFSPSGLSLNAAAHQYHRALLQEIVSGGHERLGDAIFAAQQAYAESGVFPELLSIYHLLGDPALTLH